MKLGLYTPTNLIKTKLRMGEGLSMCCCDLNMMGALKTGRNF